MSCAPPLVAQCPICSHSPLPPRVLGWSSLLPQPSQQPWKVSNWLSSSLQSGRGPWEVGRRGRVQRVALPCSQRAVNGAWNGGMVPGWLLGAAVPSCSAATSAPSRQEGVGRFPDLKLPLGCRWTRLDRGSGFLLSFHG